MTIGYLKGKSAIRIHRELLKRKRGFTNLHFWIRGYCVSTVGLDEEKVRKYIREQEEMDRNQQGQKYLGIDNEF
jgi:putative transposase